MKESIYFNMVLRLLMESLDYNTTSKAILVVVKEEEMILQTHQ